MKKRIISFLLAFVLVFATGCGNAEKNNSNKDVFVTVTDQAGREVTLEKKPEKIISGYYIATSMLIALDQDEKLVGIENDGDKRPVYGESAPQLLELPGMGTVKEFDLEKCMELDPDLVVLPYKLLDMEDSLEELGIPVIFVMPETQELLAECIELLGEVTGSSKRAAEVNKYIETKVTELERAVKDEAKPKVYLGGNSSLLMTAGPAMYQHSLIENAGAVNAGEELTDSYWAEVSYEQILTWNPDYIILASDAVYSVESVLNDTNLQDCSAVKNGRVYQMPKYIECWDSPVPGSFLGSIWMASHIHNDKVTTAMYKEVANDYYNKFYGIKEK